MSDLREAIWDRHIDDLEVVLARLQDAALTGALQGAELLEEDASLTRLYDDQSKATRHSTTAYVVGPGYDGSAIVDQRAQEAQALYDQALAQGTVDGSGFAMIEEVERRGSPESISVILTALMDYDHDLITMQGGARDFITESFHGNAGRLHEEVARAIAGAHR